MDHLMFDLLYGPLNYRGATVFAFRREAEALREAGCLLRTDPPAADVASLAATMRGTLEDMLERDVHMLVVPLPLIDGAGRSVAADQLLRALQRCLDARAAWPDVNITLAAPEQSVFDEVCRAMRREILRHDPPEALEEYRKLLRWDGEPRFLEVVGALLEARSWSARQVWSEGLSPEERLQGLTFADKSWLELCFKAALEPGGTLTLSWWTANMKSPDDERPVPRERHTLYLSAEEAAEEFRRWHELACADSAEAADKLEQLMALLAELKQQENDDVEEALPDEDIYFDDEDIYDDETFDE